VEEKMAKMFGGKRATVKKKQREPSFCERLRLSFLYAAWSVAGLALVISALLSP
jgi:hypothetical protein